MNRKDSSRLGDQQAEGNLGNERNHNSERGRGGEITRDRSGEATRGRSRESETSSSSEEWRPGEMDSDMSESRTPRSDR